MTTPMPSDKPPMQYFTVAMAGGASAADGQEAVMVPAYSGTLTPAAPERVRRLRRHLVEAMRAMREMKPAALDAAAAPVAAPTGFSARIARTACTLCGGWCCKKGADHAYLDGPTMARVRRARPELDARAILGLYTRAVANPSYQGSCIFHGEHGCTLDRDLRSHVCNSYYCSSLGALMKSGRQPASAIVISTADGGPRLSPVLTPEPDELRGGET